MSNQMDPEAGWVEARVIFNRFATLMHTLDKLMPHVERWPIKTAVMEHVEKCKYDLLKQRKQPEDFPKAAQKRGEMSDDAKRAHQERLAAIKGRS